MEPEQREPISGQPKKDKVDVAKIEQELKKYGYKLIGQTRTWLGKFKKDTENRIVIKGSKKKLNSYVAPLVLLINQQRLSYISIKFDIQTEVSTLEIEEPLLQIIESNLQWLRHVRIKEEIPQSQTDSPPMLITQFFTKFFCHQSNNIDVVEVDSNNDQTINEIIQKATQFKIRQLRFSLPRDISRVKSALQSFSPKSLRHLSLFKSTAPPHINITLFMEAIQHMESLEVLQVGYDVTRYEQEFFRSVNKLKNLEKLELSHPIVMTEQIVKNLYRCNIFLCNLKCFSNGIDWSPNIKKHLYAIISRQLNYNRLRNMIKKLEDSVLSSELRKDYLLQLCDFMRLVIF